MRTEKFPLSPPSLEELAQGLETPLKANYKHATVSVVQCPDLREAPFHLATQGLSGEEKIAELGGQSNLFPYPKLEAKFDLSAVATAMGMDGGRGSLIGAGAGPFHVIGQNCELAPNLSWQDGLQNIDNGTRYIKIDSTNNINVQKSPSLDCALMANLFGSSGLPGPVLKITARGRVGPEKSFTECIQKALNATYGDTQIVSLGGAFVVKAGRTRYHIMPDFPSEDQLPFTSSKQVNDWLTFHDFDTPIVCLSVLHSADPHQKIGLRLEHTRAFSPIGKNVGGHYHYDIESTSDNEDVEYEGYFNTAKVIYRVERPEVTFNRD